MGRPALFVEGRVKDVAFVVQDFARLCWTAVSGIFGRPRYLRETVIQMDLIGAGSLPIVLLTGLFTGMVLALQSSVTMQKYGATMYVGNLVSVSMVRELGPVLSALMVAGRVGSGIAAELGSMVDTEQIDAMMVEGTDPIRRLVIPRLVACIVMLPLLMLITDAVGLLGGYLIALYQLRIDTTFYWRSVFDMLHYDDLPPAIFKPAFFGFIIAMVGCYQGLRTHGGTVGVGKSTTESVVYSSVLILASDFFITKVFMYIM